jgi:hypothetical protein
MEGQRLPVLTTSMASTAPDNAREKNPPSLWWMAEKIMLETTTPKSKPARLANHLKRIPRKYSSSKTGAISTVANASISQPILDAIHIVIGTLGLKSSIPKPSHKTLKIITPIIVARIEANRPKRMKPINLLEVISGDDSSESMENRLLNRLLDLCSKNIQIA